MDLQRCAGPCVLLGTLYGSEPGPRIAPRVRRPSPDGQDCACNMWLKSQIQKVTFCGSDMCDSTKTHQSQVDPQLSMNLVWRTHRNPGISVFLQHLPPDFQIFACNPHLDVRFSLESHRYTPRWSVGLPPPEPSMDHGSPPTPRWTMAGSPPTPRWTLAGSPPTLSMDHGAPSLLSIMYMFSSPMFMAGLVCVYVFLVYRHVISRFPT